MLEGEGGSTHPTIHLPFPFADRCGARSSFQELVLPDVITLRSQLGTATTSEANCAASSQAHKNSYSICAQECSSAEFIRCSRDLALLQVQKLSLMETI